MDGRVAIRFDGISMLKNPKLVQAIQKLHEWHYMQRLEGDFTHHLFSSFQKANESEFEKLEASFPIEAQAYRLWFKATDHVEFFKSYGIVNGSRR